jgi:FecR protein
MDRCQRWTAAVLLAVFAAMSSTASRADTRIGVAASTVPHAEGVVGSDSQSLSPGSELYAGEKVRTGNLGKADLVFVDNTNLTVGPTSEVVLDKFVYDPTGSKSSVVMQATRGAFRFVTGTQDHRAYQVNTPYGSLGDRESLANFMRDIPGEVSSPPSASLSYGEESNFGGTTNGTGGGTTVEVVVKPKGEKRNLCPNGQPAQPGARCAAECEAVVRLVNGQGASFTSLKGKRVELHNPGEVVCITPNGDIVRSTSSESILAFDLAQLGAAPPSATIAGTLTSGTPTITVPVVTPTHP